MADIMESVAGNLQQRIGQLVSQYEVDMAVLRAQASEQLESLQTQFEAVKQELEELKESNVQAEAANVKQPDAA